jgi:hypothetical protein
MITSRKELKRETAHTQRNAALVYIDYNQHGSLDSLCVTTKVPLKPDAEFTLDTFQHCIKVVHSAIVVNKRVLVSELLD